MANLRFQNALERKVQKVPPIWFMRQAGRYHQHYQELRKKHSFMELCKNPELAAEVAWGPVQDFDFDVAILFSDLLFPLEGLGMGLEYTDAGPRLGWHLTSDNFKKLLSVEKAVESLKFQKTALQLTRKKIPQDKSIIGFVGGAWTLYVYAVEGSHAGSLINSKKDPRLLKLFFDHLHQVLEANIQLQLEGGAEIVMLFDTAAGELSPQDFHEIIVPSLQRLSQKFPGKLGYYSKGTQQSHLRHEFFKNSLLAGLGIDHRWDLKEAFSLSKSGFIQGNFDQSLLHADDFETKLMIYLNALQKLPVENRVGWVSGLGHGVLPKTPEKNVRLMVARLREVLS